MPQILNPCLKLSSFHNLAPFNEAKQFLYRYVFFLSIIKILKCSEEPFNYDTRSGGLLCCVDILSNDETIGGTSAPSRVPLTRI